MDRYLALLDLAGGKVETFAADMSFLRSFVTARDIYMYIDHELYLHKLLTHICSLTRLSWRKTVFTLKSMPTVETKAEVNESSA